MSNTPRDRAYPQVPLTQADQEALETLFKGVNAEEIHQIEKIAAFYAVAPLEPWEEQGWILNSSISKL
ncbi:MULTISPECIES: hypothetical protein [unclassified Coleofasciculus]|uniref:hypothetical protein n=1 Tax=unclassified Coleofasciculus TaxID=2692782 RepID=UPI00187E394D|nr:MULTISPECIES: hypothetical protein [unclassified Coleofasciculus]MBE9128446.1 hypothetical protein [Coleofasciculus sp. LEGE 07081]MBE9149397.1 hypothetical protein [Coleofasciculus sp. LEGE 07092]